MPALAVPGENARVSALRAREAYVCFEALLERALPALRGAYATLTPDALKLTLEGAAVEPPEGSGAAAYVEDGCTYVRLSLREAGEDAPESENDPQKEEYLRGLAQVLVCNEIYRRRQRRKQGTYGRITKDLGFDIR